MPEYKHKTPLESKVQYYMGMVERHGAEKTVRHLVNLVAEYAVKLENANAGKR